MILHQPYRSEYRRKQADFLNPGATLRGLGCADPGIDETSAYRFGQHLPVMRADQSMHQVQRRNPAGTGSAVAVQHE